MPQITAPLQHAGALVNVVVGLCRQDVRILRQALRPIAQPMAIEAILDTGAEATCLDDQGIVNLDSAALDSVDPNSVIWVGLQADTNLASEHVPQESREPGAQHDMVAIDHFYIAEAMIQFQIKTRLEIKGWITERFRTGVDKAVPGILIFSKYSKSAWLLSIPHRGHDVILCRFILRKRMPIERIEHRLNRFFAGNADGFREPSVEVVNR